jgi:hypothetical protein
LLYKFASFSKIIELETELQQVPKSNGNYAAGVGEASLRCI